MEPALVSVVTGALKPVLEKLSALMGDEYTHLKEVRHDIKFLTDELSAMHAFLLNMSQEEEPDVEDKAWMMAVRELSYDMEDSVDDFMQSIDDKDVKPNGFIEKIKHSIGKLVEVKTHRRIGEEIQDLKKNIIQVGDKNERYKVANMKRSYRSGMAISSTNNVTIDPRAIAIFEHASKLTRIDESKVELIKMLSEHGRFVSMPQQPKIVAIVGAGGMGKTTLAKQVYQELPWHFHCLAQFPCKSFLSIFRNPNIMNIMSTLFTDVSKEHYDTEAGSIQHLISKINHYLGNRRYFIVVDDICEVETWDVIKSIFPKNSHGSIIITTTHMRDVADSCRSSFNGHVYNIKPLDMLHSRQLLHRRLFNSEEHCPYLEDTLNQILKNCDGLPLAIIVISGLLANKERTVDIWNQVRDSIGRACERNHSVESVMNILSLTYCDLPPHLKSCLLYMGIFPKGTIIEKECLIMGWVAEGFIYKEGTYTAYELGEMCFNDLVNRSLVQLVNEEYQKPNSCRVHVRILDFIISKSMEENFVTLVGVPFVPINVKRKVRRLSLQGGTRGNSILPTRDLVWSHAQSLHVFGNVGEIPPLDKFRYLRIMDLGGSDSYFYRNYELKNHLIENIGRLLHLRYLNLSGTGITDLPQHMGCLQHLESMDLRGTMVRVLPASIVNLAKLVHLLTDGNVKFPDGIVKLQSLEVLKQVSVFKQTFNFMQELCQLRNLGMMCIDFEEHKVFRLMGCTRMRFEEVIPDGDRFDATEWEEPIASFFCGFVSLTNLHYLKIRGGCRFLPLETVCPFPVSLQKLFLFLQDQPLSKVPEWIPSLVNLQELSIDVKRITHRGLCILGSLPALLKLELEERCYNREDRILTVSGEVGFPYLTKLQYGTSSRGMDLKFEAGSMPKLETLVFSVGASYILKSDTFGFDFGIINLPSLVTLECRASGDSSFKAAMKSAASTHPNCPTVLFPEIHL